MTQEGPPGGSALCSVSADRRLAPAAFGYCKDLGPAVVQAQKAYGVGVGESAKGSPCVRPRLLHRRMAATAASSRRWAWAGDVSNRRARMCRAVSPREVASEEKLMVRVPASEICGAPAAGCHTGISGALAVSGASVVHVGTSEQRGERSRSAVRMGWPRGAHDGDERE